MSSRYSKIQPGLIKKSVVRRLIKALRSGKYEKNVGQLAVTSFKGSRSYCCLGVMCEIVKTDKALGADDVDLDRATPDHAVTRHVLTPQGRSNPPNAWDPLIARNDGMGGRPRSHRQIADALERAYFPDGL